MTQVYAKAHPKQLADVISWARAAPLSVVLNELAACHRAEDYEPRLHELDMPVLLRVGELDVTTPPTLSEGIARRVPKATLQVVPGCAHVLLYEDPATLDVVTRFLS